MTLYPGDLLLTGTPAGVSKVSNDDVLDASLTDDKGKKISSLNLKVKLLPFEECKL